MKIAAIHINVKKVPPIVLRKRHVLIMIRDEAGRYILGHKNKYPELIYRFVGGGVEPTENYDEAAARELYEELKIYPQSHELRELIRIIAHVTDETGTTYKFTTGVYLFDLGINKMLPSSDLDGVVRLTQPAFEDLITRYFLLSKDVEPHFGFAWYDYGQLYGNIHRIALGQSKKLTTSM